MPERLSAMKPLMREMSAFIFTKLRCSAPRHKNVMIRISGTAVKAISASRQFMLSIITMMPISRKMSRTGR